MLIAIVVLFAICWSPTLIDGVLVVFGVLDQFHFGPIKHARQAFAIMSYANSCVNPVVYAFMSKNFRKSFKKTLVCRRVCSTQGRHELQRIVRGDEQHCQGHSTVMIARTSTVCQQNVDVSDGQLTTFTIAAVSPDCSETVLRSADHVCNLLPVPRRDDINQFETA